MKLTFSNLLAIASILVWASAWAATEANAISPAKAAPAADYTPVSRLSLRAAR